MPFTFKGKLSEVWRRARCDNVSTANTVATKAQTKYDRDPYRATGDKVPLQVVENGRGDGSLTFDPEPFDKKHFVTKSCQPPISLGKVDPNLLDRDYTRCLNLPFKLPNDPNYYLPAEWQQLAPLIEQILAVEICVNQQFERYYAYLTVDSGYYQQGDYQREPGCHCDGYQSVNTNPKTPAARNYAVGNNGSTIFYPMPFNITNIDDSVYDVFSIMDKQKDRAVALPVEENLLYAFGAYAVHEAGPIARTGHRTWVRVVFEIKRYGQIGDSTNALLPIIWSQVENNFRDTLL